MSNDKRFFTVLCAIFILLVDVGNASIPRPSCFRWYTSQDCAPVKLTQTGFNSQLYSAFSMYSCEFYGPTFGGGFDIYISDKASSNTHFYSNLGWYYGPPSEAEIFNQMK